MVPRARQCGHRELGAADPEGADHEDPREGPYEMLCANQLRFAELDISAGLRAELKASAELSGAGLSLT